VPIILAHPAQGQGSVKTPVLQPAPSGWLFNQAGSSIKIS